MTETVWHINDEKTWPPQGRVAAPVSYSQYSKFEECGLKAVFATAPKQLYPQKTSDAANLGNAFHRAVDLLHKTEVSGLRGAAEFAQKAVDYFDEGLATLDINSRTSSRLVASSP